MDFSPSATLPTARSHRWIIGVVMVAFVVSLVTGWILLRGARARHEAIAERETRATAERTRTATQAAGEDQQAARAVFNYLVRIRAQLRDHEATLQRLEDKNVFSWNIHDRADLEADRNLIRDFLATNSRLTDSLQYGADLIRAELNTANVPAGVRDSALALYAKSQNGILPLQMRVRHFDQVLGENALAVLNLLDLNWGGWRRDESTGRLDFENSVTLAAFKDYVEKTRAAAAGREAAQEELIEYQRSRPSP